MNFILFSPHEKFYEQMSIELFVPDLLEIICEIWFFLNVIKSASIVINVTEMITIYLTAVIFPSYCHRMNSFVCMWALLRQQQKNNKQHTAINASSPIPNFLAMSLKSHTRQFVSINKW